MSHTREAERALAEHVVVVLHQTQDIVNVAGVVRAMANMGLRRLRLVEPAAYDDFRILGIAHQGGPVVERIELHESLQSALADTAHVVGTSARRRTSQFVWQHPRAAAPELLALARSGATVAILFGREDKGLANQQLDLCDRILNVPTAADATSLNLAQAVLIVAYDLFLAAGGAARPLPRARKTAPLADWNQHQQLFAAVEDALEAIDFFKTRQPPAIMRTVRAALRRAVLDQREAKLLRAMAIEVRKVVRRARGLD
ncbi:MAG: RNA methyltransferase [Longimicrobiales bacterium]